MRSSTACAVGAAAGICIPCIPRAAADRVGEACAAGRAGLLAVHPQAPSTRAPAKIHAPGTRPLIGPPTPIRTKRVGPMPSLTLTRILLTVILPGPYC
jgi:hypothetical protein